MSTVEIHHELCVVYCRNGAECSKMGERMFATKSIQRTQNAGSGFGFHFLEAIPKRQRRI
jgi:hypothetical protein